MAFSMPKTEVAEDTLSILESYIADMTAIITPDIRGQRMLVDRNDIWGNMLTMEEKIGHLPTIDWFARVWAWETYTRNPDDKTRRNEESYYKRVQNVKKDIILPYGIRIASVFEELKSIYDNQVKPYENMDDDYEPITEANYHKHTDNWGVCELCSLDTPDWASDKLNTAGDTTTALMEAPLFLVEGISQGATDAVEQRGITYLS